ncbi:hypothetical protein C9J21_18650 [Photobacterium phosphoreum]|jgi:hypothetical protein|uniref:hypothetical protein n=1 Tax=Photobacterium phosphoreum TaxID=659 RepID=UPI000D15391B|nr:hypothetical protein [Photobacterium phosphoreum]PSW30472.1 hypothetical protein C9J21_18650 [Photobacterium phosphoreum]
MKKSLFTLLLFPLLSQASSYHFQAPVVYGGEDSLDAWHYTEAVTVPIKVKHIGEKTPYYLEVNNQQISDVFYLEGEEEISVDVPITLEAKHGSQLFRICSVAFHGAVGSRICTKAELFLIQPINKK